MAVKVNIDLGYEFAVKADFRTVFDTLSDVPSSASHFPKVDQLVDLGDGVYRWELAKIGLAQISLQTIYASRYVSDRTSGSVVWTPVAGVGNALVSGSWKIIGKKKSTHLELHVQGALVLPLPALMKVVIAPVVEGEFEAMTEQYIFNLITHFGGEV